jgi:hypothetical protein
VLVVEPAPELLLLAFGGFELPDELLPDPELSQAARPNAASNVPATNHFLSMPFSFPLRRLGPRTCALAPFIRQ